MDAEELEKAYDATTETLALEGEFGIEELQIMLLFLVKKSNETTENEN